MARRRRRQESLGELFRIVHKRAPHLPASTVAEVVSAVPDAKQDWAKRPWRDYGGQATAKGWTAQRRLGPVQVLDAINQLHQIYREGKGKDVHAPEQIQRLHSALGPLGRRIVIDPARHRAAPFGVGAGGETEFELAEDLVYLTGFVLVLPSEQAFH